VLLKRSFAYSQPRPSFENEVGQVAQMNELMLWNSCCLMLMPEKYCFGFACFVSFHQKFWTATLSFPGKAASFTLSIAARIRCECILADHSQASRGFIP
jgi:hypothetical protein